MSASSSTPDGYFPHVPTVNPKAWNNLFLSDIDEPAISALNSTVSTDDQDPYLILEEAMYPNEKNKLESSIALLRSQIDEQRKQHDRVAHSSRRRGEFIYSQLSRVENHPLSLSHASWRDQVEIAEMIYHFLPSAPAEHASDLTKTSSAADLSRIKRTGYTSDGVKNQAKKVEMLKSVLADVTTRLQSERRYNADLETIAQRSSIHRQALDDMVKGVESASFGGTRRRE